MFPEAIGLENVDRRDYHLATVLEVGFEGIRDMEVPSTGGVEAPSPLKTFPIRVRDGLSLFLDRLYPVFFDEYHIRVRRPGKYDLYVIHIYTNSYNRFSCVEKPMATVDEITINSVGGF